MSDQPPEDILNSTVRQFLAATASKQPTPGGGSVAALAGALAASLAEMALQYTVGRKQFETVQGELATAIDKLRKAGGLMQDLVKEDMAAYASLSEVLKIPQDKRTEDPRYLPAVVAAIRAPESIGGLAFHILQLCDEFLDKCNPYLVSDLGVAAALAHATVHAAELNVLVNLRMLPNPLEGEDIRRRVAELSLKADTVWHHVRSVVHGRL